MRILLVGNLPEDRQESMQRFTQLLQAGLTARGHSVSLITPTLRVARLVPHYHYAGASKYLGYVDKYLLFPPMLRRAVGAFRPDVVHITDHANAPYADGLRHTPVLVTCHDLLQIRAARGEFVQTHVGWAGRRQQAWILRRLARVTHVACVSAATRDHVFRLTGLNPNRVSLVHNALNYPYRPLAPETAQNRLEALRLQTTGNPQRLTAPEGFVLHVGGSQWYKNRPGLLAIYAELRRRLKPAPLLVLVGPPLSREESAQADALGVAPFLVFFSAVTNAQLEALYRLAECLVFPSWEEGFGWPVAEAQACNCPVFASNRPPMTEVGGTSSVYFDPRDPAAAAQIIADAWPERARQRARGLEQCPRWDADLMLSAYEAIYQRLAP